MRSASDDWQSARFASFSQARPAGSAVAISSSRPDYRLNIAQSGNGRLDRGSHRQFVKITWLLLFAVGAIGCAHQQLNAPSGVGVSSAVGRTQMSVEQAKRYNDVAVIHNANAKTRVERIEAKAGVIEKYWGK